MKKIFLIFLLQSCQWIPEEEINLFFERLSVLVIKKDIINFNIQNAYTTRTAEGGAYIPKEAINCKAGKCTVTPLTCAGIGCNKSDMKPRSPIMKYEPEHPDAKKNGYVHYPDLNVQEEMTKLIRVQRAIEFLIESAPFSKEYFYSNEVQKYFRLYPALDNGYNFRKLLNE